MGKALAWVMVGLLAALACACAAGTEPPPPTLAEKVATVEGYCAARAAAECSSVVVSQCGAKDAPTCESARSASCMQQVPQGTTYQPGKAPACITAVQASYGMGILTVAGQAAIDTACGPVLFAGPGASRSPCTNEYDCNSALGLSCIQPTGQTTSKCLVPNVVDNGGPCPNEADVCSDNFYCEPKSLECQPDAMLDAPCNPGWVPCADAFYCTGGGPFATCIAKGAEGAACGMASDCASGLCDKLTDQAQGNCASQIVLTSLDSLCASFK
jgi:hypothetical protein